MKIKKIILWAALILVIGGVAYIGTTDIKINQEQVIKTIPNDGFYKDE